MNKQNKYIENEEEQKVNQTSGSETFSGENTEEDALLNENDKTASCESTLEEKLTEANDKYLRLVAEFDNFRKRTARERINLLMTANEDVISGMLPILDDFERAIDAMKTTENNDSMKEGVVLIYEKLFAYLQGRGLQRIDAKGKELDTDFHEAVGKFPAPDKRLKGKILDVVQNGYMLNDKVIRYAKVIVGE